VHGVVIVKLVAQVVAHLIQKTGFNQGKRSCFNT
jgi:hypothetical protein